jgi:hypothetical protein
MAGSHGGDDMWHGLRTLSIFSTILLLLLPLTASSAIPAVWPVVSAIVAVVGAAWTGFNLVVVGARSAAFAQADEIWVSDPPNITRAALEEGTLATSAAEWNIGHLSSRSIAPAAAPSGNAITVTAESQWEGFIFSPEINMTEMKRASEDGVLWAQGFAYGTLEGLVTEVHPNDGPGVAQIPFRYIISDVSLPYERKLDMISFELSLRAWKMDDEDTRPQESIWHEQIKLASVSIDTAISENIRVEGEVTEDDFAEIDTTDQDSFQVRLKEPIEREVVLHVPFPDGTERVVIGFRVEVSAAFQVGKR